MNHKLVLSSAIASVVSLGLLSAVTAHAQEKGKEKCYGVAKAGQNDCANLAGTHSCAGLSKTDNSAGDWRYVAAGSCAKMKGMNEAEAKAAQKK